MADIAHQAVSRGASRKSAADRHALPPLSATPVGQWRALADRAIEANGYYQPDWELAVDASARGRTGAKALSAFGDGGQLIGFLPVVSMRRIYRIPCPPSSAPSLTERSARRCSIVMPPKMPRQNCCARRAARARMR